MPALDYSEKPHSKPRWPLRRQLTLAVALAALLYVAAFEFVYANRKPAANMLYFIYAESDTADAACYYIFYPAYWCQRHLFNCGQSHNDDRPPITFDPTFKG